MAAETSPGAGKGKRVAEVTRSPSVPERPYLKPWYRLAEKDGRMLFEYGHSVVALDGKAVEKLLPVLLPLLDGTRTVEDINAYLGDTIAPAVENALQMLAEHGLLTNGPPLAPDTPGPVAQTARFLSATSPDGVAMADLQQSLMRAQASIVGSGTIAQEVARLLRLSGVSRLELANWPESTDELKTWEFAIAAPDPAELPKLEQFNRLALEARLPWLQTLPFDGRIAAVGPLYVPDDTCCFECYRRRRASNLDYGKDDFWTLDGEPASYPSAPPLDSMIATLAATLALAWLGGSQRMMAPAVMHAIEWGTDVSMSEHHVYRVPRCPACSEARDLGTPSPWYD